MSRRSLLVPMIFMIVLAAVAAIVPPAIGSKPMLGLDLQGGFSVVLQAKAVNGELPSEEAVERAKEIIRQRVDGLGVAEPDITRQGRTVVVQLPGVTNRAKAESVIGCTARLEFRPVLQQAQNLATATPSTTAPDGTTTTTGAGATTTTAAGEEPTTSSTVVMEPSTTVAPDSGSGEDGGGTVGGSTGEGALPAQFKPTTTTTEPPATTTTAPPETTVAATTEPDGTTTTEAGATTTTTEAGSTGEPSDGGDAASGCGGPDTPVDRSVFGDQAGDVAPSEDGSTVYLLGPETVSGEALSKAEARLEGGQWAVMAAVRSKDRIKANEMFNMCAGGQPTCPTTEMAIVLDGQVISAPAVQQPNLADEEFRITGNFDASGAKDLALVLRYGSLPVVFEQAALQQVSATLGSDSLRAGLIAGAIGIVALALYMILYYRGFGMTVVLSLLVWMALMYGLVCFLSETQGLALTLAGITGIIVSVGTTVDTYVVVFERVKDLIREGKTVRRATELGYESGIRTVLTANGAAFIGAFLLWWLTVGPVRGFAYFLGLSVILDLAVAILFTRPLILLASRSERFAGARFFGIGTATDQVSGAGRDGRGGPDGPRRGRRAVARPAEDEQEGGER